MQNLELIQSSKELKSCCASLYESDWAKLLLGDSFHPGGLSLTQRLAELLELKPGQRVLDVATGTGTSAIFLAQQFGCQVVGIDYGAGTICEAKAKAAEAGLANQVQFEQGDAEELHFVENSFDAIICECAFCTFPQKATAAKEFARVLRPDGRVGLSDLTRSGSLPAELDTLLAWIVCIADARPVEEYRAYLHKAGFEIIHLESHADALIEMVRSAQIKLLGTEIMVKLNKLQQPNIDLEQAKRLAHHTVQVVNEGKLGYVLVVGSIHS